MSTGLVDTGRRCGFLAGRGLLVLLKQGRGPNLPLVKGGTGQGQALLCQPGDCLAVTEMGEWCFGSFPSNPSPQQHFSFTDSHSLHYDFNISSDKQPWCMVQGKMDEEKYLLYDCGSNKAIHSCEGELGTLSNMGNELKPLLADIKREKYADGGKFEKFKGRSEQIVGLAVWIVFI